MLLADRVALPIMVMGWLRGSCFSIVDLPCDVLLHGPG